MNNNSSKLDKYRDGIISDIISGLKDDGLLSDRIEHVISGFYSSPVWKSSGSCKLEPPVTPSSSPQMEIDLGYIDEMIRKGRSLLK